MTVKFFDTTDGGQVEALSVELQGKKLSFDVSEGYEQLAETVKEHICMNSSGEDVGPDKPQEWLELLPSEFSGSYLRAVAVE